MSTPGSSAQRSRPILVWLTICAIFLASLWLPAGYSVNSLYVGAILLAIRVPQPRLAFRVAALSTSAVIVSSWLVPVSTSLPATAFSRGVLIATLWLAAVIVERYRHGESAARVHASARMAAEDALRKSGKELEDVKHALDQSAIVATTDVQGTITSVNEKFCEISKYSHDELIGQNHRILNSGLHSTDFFKEMYRTIGRGRVWRGELRNRAKDGSFYWVDTTIVPFVDNRDRPYQYIAIRYDITDRKQSEAALRAQTALVQVGRMAAVVAHEVRNPLAGIRGAVQVIGRRLAPGSTEQAVAQEVITRIDTLNAIVQDLLLFARPRQPVFARVPAADVIGQTVKLLEQDPKFAGVTVHVEPTDVTLTADVEQLKLVLSNLLINAAQAMAGTGEILVSARTSGDWHELRVVDHGPGIPPDVAERLFEPFFTTKHRGTGLGLATAKRIVEIHGGTLALDSEPGHGATAIIRLPASPEARTAGVVDASAVHPA